MDKDISKIGLGTVQFGIPYGISNKSGQTTENEVSEILGVAKKNKITFLDSASAYGNAEKIIGKNDLSSFRVVSKFMPSADGNTLEDQFSRSLSNLKLQKLYAYMAHRPVDLLNDPEQWEILNDLKSKGLIEKIGYSLNSPKELDKLLDSGFEPDIIQVPYNYLDRRFEDHLRSMSEKCEIHIRSVFLQGLFFMDPEEMNDYFDEVKPILRNLQNEIEYLNGSLLNHVLEKEFIDLVIIGVENSQQLLDNISSLNNSVELPDLKSKINEKIITPSQWPRN